jgi:hypothetical protein
MTVKFTKPEINIREKIAELDKPSGIAGEAMLRAETPQEQFNLISAGRKNLIINGAMQVAQRTMGPVSVVAYNYNTADRMRFSTTSGTLGTWTQEVVENQDVGDFIGNALKSSCSVAGSGSNVAGLNIRLELEDTERYVGQKLTLSYYAKSDAAVTLTPAVIADTDIFMGTDTLTTSYVRYTHTFTLSSLSTKTHFDMVMRVDGLVATTHYITGVQLEVGSVATPFEHRSYGEELALCQRYFYSAADGASQSLGLGVNYSSTYMMGAINFPVTMRTTPTLSAASGANYYEFIRNGAADFFNSLSLGNRSTNKIGEIYNDTEISGTVGHGGYIRTDNSAVFVHFDAEL